MQANNPHLHNVPMQVAAERGLPALAIWTVFIVSVIVGLWRLRLTAGVRPLATAGLSATAAMLVAGMSEVQFRRLRVPDRLFSLLHGDTAVRGSRGDRDAG